ncbi:hypothetical protein CASFOL_023493 [Castilleja foliolosa]|uniref:RING-type E3 ubiquitin transferase n=1 Tax=Castilleja foliolosa TaxID=1961234 RepID=A0ABD3CLV5_9LAMI
MALNHRKLLFDQPVKKYASSSCYMCYVCPENCYLTSPPPLSQTSQSKNNQMSLNLILMLSVLGSVFLYLSYFAVAKYRSRHRNSNPFENNNLGQENQGPALDNPIWHILTVGLPQSTIDSISIFKYEKGEGLIESVDCSVCLSEFKENERLRLLPKCSHAFHVTCIDTWLRSHKSCPVCRGPILIEDQINRSGNELGTRREVQTGEAGGGNQLANIISKSRLDLDPMNNKFRVFSDLADRRVQFDRRLEEPVRRSVTMDLSSGSMSFNTKKDEGCSGLYMV